MREDEVKVIRSTTSKFVGYCNKCDLMLSELNKEGRKYICSRCGNKMFPSELKTSIKKNKWANKKEYLKGNSGYYGNNFHMNKSTSEYNIDHTLNKKNNIKDDDEENTLD